MVLAVKVCCDVNAPVDVMWDTLRDVKNQPNYLSRIIKVEFKKRSKNKGLVDVPPDDFVYEEGSLWIEESLFEGKPYQSIESITSLRKPKAGNENPSVQISSQFLDKKLSRAVHIGTYTIEATEDKKKCRLHGSMGFLPGGCWAAFDMWRRRTQIRNFAQCFFQEQVNEFGAEAERRYANPTAK
ncbi:expressed unknown protein [Seminavis robusta]|uniref:Coenzyme Q-binding protein COQ10 START domain-containing protein n=1 Tax=Seminavis robusta TaxID=568900 RepID=A0A9N8DL16_9STRA|nr:expressed unknown protein [Seminavis robusta]|eukprot:Sro203_g085560.1 n/a (184) ;mRNA; r:27643-28194